MEKKGATSCYTPYKKQYRHRNGNGSVRFYTEREQCSVVFTRIISVSRFHEGFSTSKSSRNLCFERTWAKTFNMLSAHGWIISHLGILVLKIFHLMFYNQRVYDVRFLARNNHNISEQCSTLPGIITQISSLALLGTIFTVILICARGDRFDEKNWLLEAYVRWFYFPSHVPMSRNSSETFWTIGEDSGSEDLATN